jgi:hypothetical protein
MEDLRPIAEEELEDTLLEQVGMQDAVDGAKVFGLKIEKVVCRREEKEEKCKGTGQPLHAEIDSMLQSH